MYQWSLGKTEWVMKNIPEFYPRRQGRPGREETTDLETRQSSLYSMYLFYKEEYARMEELLKEQTAKLEELIKVAKEVILQLTILTEEDTDGQTLDD